MDKLIKILESPSKTDLKQGYGLYKLLYKGKGDITYESYQTAEDYRITQIKQKMFFDMKIPIKIIEELEDSVRDATNRDRDMDD